MRKLYARDERIMVTWKQINETGNIGMKDETRGNRDKWRGVRDVTEIGWTLEQKRYSGGRWSGMDLSEIHW